MTKISTKDFYVVNGIDPIDGSSLYRICELTNKQAKNINNFGSESAFSFDEMDRIIDEGIKKLRSSDG